MKHLFIAVLTFGILSCRTRAVFQSSRPPQPPTPPADSVIALKLTDNRALPDSAFFLGTVSFRFKPGTIRRGLDSLFRFVKAEARQHGGNVLRLRQADFGFDALLMKWDLYSLPRQPFANYCAALDSADEAYHAFLQGRATVHLLDRDDFGRRGIFLNDSLLTTMKGVGFDGVRNPGKASFQLGHGGRLNIENAGFINIDVGKEYWIILYTTMVRHQAAYHYLLTDRDGFENRCLMVANIF